MANGSKQLDFRHNNFKLNITRLKTIAGRMFTSVVEVLTSRLRKTTPPGGYS